MQENLLTVTDAAKLLDRSGQSVRAYEKSGKLPALRTTNGIRLFRKADVELFKEKLRTRNREPETGG